VTPWFGLPIAIVLGAIAGAAIGYPTFRLRGSYFALAMLAYPLALVYLFDWLGYQEVTLPIKRDAPGWYMQYTDQRVYLALALGLLAVALLISLAIERSRFGMSLLAIKENELAAEAAGVDTLRWKLWALTVSGTLAAGAGGLYAVILLVVTRASVFGLVTSAQAMILPLFGGAGTLWGPVIGAAILVPLSEVLQAELGHLIPGVQGIVYGIAIILVILLAPEGIYWRIRDLLRGHAPTSAPTAATPAVPMPATAAKPAAKSPSKRQQMLAIGRGMASSPKLLMLDEPSMGLAPLVTDAIFECIERLHREHALTILLVEQRVAEAIEHCDYGYVLETGRVALSGTVQQLSADDRVRQAYLGI